MFSKFWLGKFCVSGTGTGAGNLQMNKLCPDLIGDLTRGVYYSRFPKLGASFIKLLEKIKWVFAYCISL
jgi:hypothetical protein